MSVQSILHGAKALVPAKVSLIDEGSHYSQGDEQIEDARPAVALEEPPPPQHEADEEHRQGCTEPLVNGHAEDTDVAFHPEQPAGNGGEWRDHRGKTQGPPAGVAERLLAKDPAEDVAADRDRNQRGREVDQDRVDLVALTNWFRVSYTEAASK